MKIKPQKLRSYSWVILFFIFGFLVGVILLIQLTNEMIMIPHPKFVLIPDERYSISDSDCREQAITQGYESKGLSCTLLYVKSDSCPGYEASPYCCIESAICNCYYIKD